MENSKLDSLFSKDSIYADHQQSIGAFIFDDKVASVFDDMIKRSVPGYAPINALIGILAQKHVLPKTHVYDLGCSLGAGTLAMRRRIPYADCEIIAIDKSEAMVRRCRANMDSDLSPVPVKVICDDLLNVKIENASMVVMNFTLQFISPEQRFRIIQKIFDGLLPSGIFVISEKIKFEDPFEQREQEDFYHTFKKLNGYSDLEISQKRTALENVLIPDTLSQHQQRLKDAGFQKSFVWFQCFNFCSLVAFKN